MVNFEATWDGILTRLRAEHRALGVKPENMQLMAFEEKIGLKPPYLAVAMIPGDFTGSISAKAIETRATVEIFCLTSEGKSNADRIKAACRLGSAVIAIIETWEADRIHWGKAPLLLDSVNGEYAATSVQFSIPHTP